MKLDGRVIRYVPCRLLKGFPARPGWCKATCMRASVSQASANCGSMVTAVRRACCAVPKSLRTIASPAICIWVSGKSTRGEKRSLIHADFSVRSSFLFIGKSVKRDADHQLRCFQPYGFHGIVEKRKPRFCFESGRRILKQAQRGRAHQIALFFRSGEMRSSAPSAGDRRKRSSAVARAIAGWCLLRASSMSFSAVETLGRARPAWECLAIVGCSCPSVRKPLFDFLTSPTRQSCHRDNQRMHWASRALPKGPGEGTRKLWSRRGSTRINFFAGI